MDMISYVMGQKSAGGGGGSDLSIAEITLTAEQGEDLGGTVGAAVITYDEYFDISSTYIDKSFSGGDTAVIQIVLYKGKAIARISTYDENAVIETSGGIEHLEDIWYLVTGDCTVTVSAP